MKRSSRIEIVAVSKMSDEYREKFTTQLLKELGERRPLVISEDGDVEFIELYDEESSDERMKQIGQNGNTGNHYKKE